MYFVKIENVKKNIFFEKKSLDNRMFSIIIKEGKAVYMSTYKNIRQEKWKMIQKKDFAL